MKKYILLVSIVFIGCNCFGQKVKIYKNVDTMYVYDNAEIIIYTNKGRVIKRDTIYFDKMNRNIKIINADEVNMMYGQKLKKINCNCK